MHQHTLFCSIAYSSGVDCCLHVQSGYLLTHHASSCLYSQVLGVVENMSTLHVSLDTLRFINTAAGSSSGGSSSGSGQQSDLTAAVTAALQSALVDSGLVGSLSEVTAAADIFLPTGTDRLGWSQGRKEGRKEDWFCTHLASPCCIFSSCPTFLHILYKAYQLLLTPPPTHLLPSPPGGGAARMCAQLGLQLLGQVPLDPLLGQAAEEGRYVMDTQEQPAAAAAGEQKHVGNGTADGMVNGAAAAAGGGGGVGGQQQQRVPPSAAALQAIVRQVVQQVEASSSRSSSVQVK